MRANSGFLPSKPGLPPPTSRPGGTSKEDIEQELLAFARQRELDASPFASGAEPPGFEPPRWQASRPPSLPAPAPAHVRAVGFAASRPHSATIDSSEQDHEGASSFMVPLDTLDSVDPDHPQDAKRVGMPASRSFEHTGSSYLGVNSTQHDSLPSLPDSRAEALQSPAAKPEALPSFVQQARREARWRSPWVRAVMGLLALTLAALLLAQLAVHHRNLLAAHYPESHPWLNQLCEPLACQVDHLQRIESIVVDASGFNKLAPAGSGTTNAREAYKLSLTLRNTHSLDIALPHIELSLQDAQEQTVLRRVLAPADLGGTTNTLAARGEWAGSATLQLESALKDGARIAGYRIIAFYP
jgi:hypothetical protein